MAIVSIYDTGARAEAIHSFAVATHSGILPGLSHGVATPLESPELW